MRVVITAFGMALVLEYGHFDHVVIDVLRVLVVTLWLTGWSIRTRMSLAMGGFFALAFVIWTVSVTLVNGRLNGGIGYSLAAILAVFFVVRDQSMPSLRRALVAVSLTVLALNTYSLFRPAIGWDGNALYFLGGKNALAPALLPVIYTLLRLWHPGSKLQRLGRSVSIGTALTSIVFAGSGTGTVVALAVLVFGLTGGRLGRRWWIWFATIPLANLVLVSGWLMSEASWARTIVEEQLGKDLTFTRRSYTWSIVLEQIQGAPLGIGRGYSFLSRVFADVAEAHNLLLEALLTAGWPGLLMLLAVIGAAMRASSRSGDRAGVFFIWAMCLLGTMESLTYHPVFWLMLGLAASGKYLTASAVQDRELKGSTRLVNV